MTRVPPWWVFLAVMGVGVVTLVRAQMYYGTLYRGLDARYYYSLAHSLVIDRDVDITNNLALTPGPVRFNPTARPPARPGRRQIVRQLADGRIPSRYPIGLSLFEVPALAVGCAVRWMAEAAGVSVSETLGYSAIEIWAVALGLLVVFAFGLVHLYRLLEEQYGLLAAAIGVIGCWMGTSLFHYSAVYPFMAHAVSFALLVEVMWVSRQLHVGGPVNRPLALLGLVLAALFLVRTQQALIAVFLLPMLIWLVLTRPIREWLPGAAIGTIACAVAVAAQVWFTYSQFGVVASSGYRAEGSAFRSAMAPHLGELLVRPSQGLFYFSPILALAVFGFVRFPRRVPAYAWPAVANAVAQLYVIAAWTLTQGDSFGSRMWSDNVAVVAFGVAVLFHHSGSRGRWSVAIAAGLAVLWTTYLMALYLGVIS